MVQNGFSSKFAEQMEYRVFQQAAAKPRQRTESDADDDDDADEAFALSDASPSANAPQPQQQGEAKKKMKKKKKKKKKKSDDDDSDETDDDDDPIDEFRQRMLDEGQDMFVDRLSGFSFAMRTFAFGPVSHADAESRRAKMKHDFILTLRATDCLPAAVKRVLKALREAGWTEPTDSVWHDLVVEMFDRGQVNLSFKKDGTPFEIW